MNNSNQEKFNSIINDFQSGSREIAIKIFLFAQEFVQYSNIHSWKNELSQYLNEIAIHKKSMAIIQNLVFLLNELINRVGSITEFIENLNYMQIDFNNTLSRIINNLQSNEIFHNDKENKIITCSYSSTIRDVLLYFSKIYAIELYLVQSIFNNNDVTIKYLNEFKESQIKIHSVGLTDIETAIEKIDFGLIGSDAIEDDIYIINGFPSLLLAENLSKLKRPLYLISERLKFINEIEISDGFDKIPINLITKIIADDNGRK